MQVPTHLQAQLKEHQHKLEVKLGITEDERHWIHKNRKLPMVMSFWTAYKIALNLVDDTDKVGACRKHLTFLRSVIRSGFNLDDPNILIQK